MVREPVGPWPEEHPRGRFEAPLMLLVPALVTAALSIVAGLLAAAPFSPLDWAKLIAEREYGQGATLE